MIHAQEGTLNFFPLLVSKSEDKTSNILAEKKKMRQNHSVDLKEQFYWISSHKARYINTIWHENAYPPVAMHAYLGNITDLIWTQDLFLNESTWKGRTMNKQPQTPELEQSGIILNVKMQI